MADPINPPWWTKILAALEKVIKDNWSGLAMILYNYEENKVGAAKQKQKTAELKEKLVENENEVLKANAGKSDLDIISESLGAGNDDPESK